MAVFDINQFLYRNFITYDALYNLNKIAFYGKSNSDQVNIFIDMRSLSKGLFNTNMEFGYKDQVTPIASSFINLAIHLREYYRSRHGVYARIWLVWATNEIAPFPACPVPYNPHSSMSYNSNEVMKDMIAKCNETLKTICPYLKDIYFVNGNRYDVSAVIQTMIVESELSHIYKGVPIIVYTKDPFACQLVANNPYTFLFVPKKTRTNEGVYDTSHLVTKKSLYYSYGFLSGYKPVNDPSYLTNLFIPSMCLANVKCKDIKILGPFNKIAKSINVMMGSEMSNAGNVGVDFVADRLIDNAYSSTPLHDKAGAFVEAKDIGITLDIRNTVITPEVRQKMHEGIVDLYSPEDLKRINDKYFINYPIDLMRL